MARPLKPRTPLAERLVEVRDKAGFKDNRNGFAERLELLPDTLGSYERGVAAPPPEVFARYHNEFGVNISWLVSGKGDIFDDPSKEPSRHEDIDPVLMEKLAHVVWSAYGEVHQKPPIGRVTREATELFNKLRDEVEDLTDAELVDAAIPKLRLQLRRRLDSAADEPGTGKRSAS